MARLKFFRNAMAVARNEFREFTRNRTAILISLVVLPLFFTTSLGAGQGSAGTTFSPTAEIPIVFVDEDLTVASGRLWETLISSPDFHGLIQEYTKDNAVAQLGKGGIYAVIVVPQGFQQSLRNNQTAQLVLYTDDGEPGLSDSVQSALTRNVQNFNPNVEVQPQRLSSSSSIVEVIQKGAIFAGFNIGLTTVLGIVQIFASFYEIAGGMSREREAGTYARLLLSPVSIGSIVLGKTLFDLVLNLVRTFIVLGFAVYAYGARPNTDMATLLALSLFLALVTMGLGFLVSSLKVGTRAVVILEFFLILFLFAFSGLIIDKELLRGFSQTVSALLPFTYGLDALKRAILLGTPLTELYADLGAVGMSAALFFGVAYLILIKSRERLSF